MSNDDALTIALGWEDETFSQVGLELTLSKPGARESCHPAGLVEANVELPGHRFSALCFGYEIASFCEQLEQCHRTLQGRAEFRNQEESVRIVMSVVDAGRGQFAVAGEIKLLGNATSPTAGLLPLPGICFTFDGLVAEQSYIPEIARQLRSFLENHRISTSHPMLRGS